MGPLATSSLTQTQMIHHLFAHSANTLEPCVTALSTGAISCFKNVPLELNILGEGGKEINILGSNIKTIFAENV